MKRPAESSRWCGHAAIPGHLGHLLSLIASPPWIYCWTHPPSLSLPWNICMANMSGPCDASWCLWPQIWSILNPLDARRLRQVLLCLPETANDHDEVNWSCLGSSRHNQTCLICAMNVNRSRNILLISSAYSDSIFLPTSKQHLANHFIMTCLIQPIPLDLRGHTRTHTQTHGRILQTHEQIVSEEYHMSPCKCALPKCQSDLAFQPWMAESCEHECPPTVAQPIVWFNLTWK